MQGVCNSFVIIWANSHLRGKSIGNKAALFSVLSQLVSFISEGEINAVSLKFLQINNVMGLKKK